VPHFKVILTTRAIQEIQDTVFYYNSKRKGLGKRFYNDLKKQIASVKLFPYSRAIRYDDIRFAMLDKFPYAAHYNIEGNSVIIHGVLSFHQDPDTFWIEK
jgi:hypothetical protein